MTNFNGKNVLITGGNSGIGLATAKLFVQRGANVIITGRDQKTLDDAVTSLGVTAFQSDAGDLADIEILIAEISAKFGHLDVLMLNAMGGQPASIATMTEKEFDGMVDVCFKGTFFSIQKAIPLLKAGSSIIVTTSITNLGGVPLFSAYAGAKAAARSLVQTAAVELSAAGIRVNAISPGPIDTPGFGRWDIPREMVEAARQQIIQRSPMKRFGRPEEVGELAVFLASDAASYITGTEVIIDGGISLLV